MDEKSSTEQEESESNKRIKRPPPLLPADKFQSGLGLQKTAGV